MPVMSKVERAFCCGAMWRTTTRAVLDMLPTDRLGEQLLEIGSGSGAIAEGLSAARPGLSITATDLDPVMVDAARAMGMTERQVLLRAEVPNALPLILGGLRTATLQVVATATIAAYASLGGLGRFLIDGIKVRQFYLALVGALLVTALALLLDGALALATRLARPAGYEAPGSSPTVDG